MFSESGSWVISGGLYRPWNLTFDKQTKKRASRRIIARPYAVLVRRYTRLRKMHREKLTTLGATKMLCRTRAAFSRWRSLVVQKYNGYPKSVITSMVYNTPHPLWTEILCTFGTNIRVQTIIIFSEWTFDTNIIDHKYVIFRPVLENRVGSCCRIGAAMSRHDLSRQLVFSRTNSRFPEMPTIRLTVFHTINSIKDCSIRFPWY